MKIIRLVNKLKKLIINLRIKRKAKHQKYLPNAKKNMAMKYFHKY